MNDDHFLTTEEVLAYLQVNLRIEEEVTKTLQLVAGLYTRLGHHIGHRLLQRGGAREPARLRHKRAPRLRAQLDHLPGAPELGSRRSNKGVVNWPVPTKFCTRFS